MKYLNVILITILLISLSLLSCNKVKPSFQSDNIEFSTDTIIFDTVFTTVGSSTRILKVYNKSNEELVISNVLVAGGQQSPFSVNVDGLAGSSFNNVTIMPKDSIFIFAKVRIDPNNENNALVVEDSLAFIIENTTKFVNLIAWGQDANYILADKFPENLPPYKIVAKEGENIVWDSPKPYVVYGYAVVDSNANLIVKEGVRVHFHSNGGLWVYKGGSIQVLGTPENKVVFEGDRLEPYYNDVAGQWEKIWINEGAVNNEFRNVVIKNGFVGIQAETLEEPMGNILILDKVEIKNMSGMGIYSRRYGIIAGNCVISNCASYLAALTQGGYYDFKHCSFANFWHKTIREHPSVFISNYFVHPYNQTVFIANLEKAYFGNCIVYGDKDIEIEIDDTQTSDIFSCNIDNCMIKYSNLESINTNYFTDCIYNLPVYFTDSVNGDFHIDTIVSPLINAGKMSVVTEAEGFDLNNDIEGVSRIFDGQPDIGAYEFNKR